MPNTAPYHHGDLPNALLDAAESLLADRGLPGFTLRGCAKIAGVSHSAPKHHFGDVRGLLTEVAARGYVRLNTRLVEEKALVGPEPQAQFLATSNAYINFARDFPEHFRIMFRSDLLDNNRENLREAALATFAEMTNTILSQRGEPLVGLVATDPDAASTQDVVDDIVIGWTFIHGYAHLSLERQFDGLTDDAEDQRRMTRAASRLSELLAQTGGTKT